MSFDNQPRHPADTLVGRIRTDLERSVRECLDEVLDSAARERAQAVKLMENFQQPYFSKSVPEFWRTWHIALSTWFRDYIFFPLRRSMLNSSNSNTDDLAPLVVPPLVTMLLSGLWHGANWTFVIWGGIHGTLIVLDMLWNHYKKPGIHLIKLSEHIKSGLRILITFNVITFTWIFFRANSLSDAVYILQNMFVNLSFKSFGIGQIMPGGKYELFILVCAIAFVGLVDVLQYRKINLRAFASLAIPRRAPEQLASIASPRVTSPAGRSLPMSSGR